MLMLGFNSVVCVCCLGGFGCVCCLVLFWFCVGWAFVCSVLAEVGLQ